MFALLYSIIFNSSWYNIINELLTGYPPFIAYLPLSSDPQDIWDIWYPQHPKARARPLWTLFWRATWRVARPLDWNWSLAIPCRFWSCSGFAQLGVLPGVFFQKWFLHIDGCWRIAIRLQTDYRYYNMIWIWIWFMIWSDLSGRLWFWYLIIY